MLFRVLGPVEAIDAGRAVPLGPPGQRFVLGVLLLEANRVVPVDRLIELCWPGEPPRSARATLQARVSKLRAALGPSVSLRTEGAGYVLDADPDAVDVHRFTRLVTAAAVADDDRAAALLREATALWRGPALTGTAAEDVTERLTLGVEEMRLGAVERLAEIELRLGHHTSMLDDLHRLVAEHPGRERSLELLVRALHTGGQTGRALELLRAHRRQTVDATGLDPGRRLRQVESELLRGDDPTVPAADPEPAVPARLAQLPAAPADFRGRDPETVVLDTLAGSAGTDQPAVLLVTGMPGVGKTALALRWAHHVSDRYPDGQLFLDLRGHARRPAVASHDALATFLRALGMTSARGAEPCGEALARRRQEAGQEEVPRRRGRHRHAARRRRAALPRAGAGGPHQTGQGRARLRRQVRRRVCQAARPHRCRASGPGGGYLVGPDGRRYQLAVPRYVGTDGKVYTSGDGASDGWYTTHTQTGFAQLDPGADAAERGERGVAAAMGWGPALSVDPDRTRSLALDDDGYPVGMGRGEEESERATDYGYERERNPLDVQDRSGKVDAGANAVDMGVGAGDAELHANDDRYYTYRVEFQEDGQGHRRAVLTTYQVVQNNSDGAEAVVPRIATVGADGNLRYTDANWAGGHGPKEYAGDPPPDVYQSNRD